MPTRRHRCWLHPTDWRELWAPIRFCRAGGRCETCGQPHGRMVLHLGMPAGGTRRPADGATGMVGWCAV